MKNTAFLALMALVVPFADAVEARAGGQLGIGILPKGKFGHSHSLAVVARGREGEG